LHAWARAATHGQESDGVDGELVNLAVSHDCGGCEVFGVEWVEEEEEEEEGRKKEERRRRKVVELALTDGAVRSVGSFRFRGGVGEEVGSSAQERERERAGGRVCCAMTSGDLLLVASINNQDTTLT